jgi:MFS transporter, PAT family, beta-lactamase induction signal transducer AmpG
MKSWLKALAIYRDRRMLAILLMGFSSGLPYALTGSTLSIWLKRDGVSLTDIGLFSLVGLAYIGKFLWSPVLDRVALPLLSARLGRRRSWALVIQLGLALAILGLGFTDPREHRLWVAAAAVLVAFLSASQDIVIDAYRVELLAAEEQGAGAAATQIGYRFGIIVSTAGALYLSAFGWRAAYAVMALCVLVGFITVLMTREPSAPPAPAAGDWLRSAVLEPFRDFTRHRFWIAILVFVLLFKLGDAIAANMAGPLYVTLGFTNAEIASITKVLGMGAAMAGVFLGGLLVARAGVMRALLIGGVVQMLSLLMYIVQYWAGHDLVVLAITIAGENITGGIGSAAFVAYLSRLCSRAFTATQYALLSALASVARIVIASSGGWIADRYGWILFFLAATLACLPGLALLVWLMGRADSDTPRAAVPAQ